VVPARRRSPDAQTAVAMKVVQGIYNGVTTRELDQLAAETCAYSSTYHPDWSILAARIAVSDLQKMTEASFSRNAKRLFEHTHPKVRRVCRDNPRRLVAHAPKGTRRRSPQTGTPAPLIAEDVYALIEKNAARLDAAMHYERDFE